MKQSKPELSRDFICNCCDEPFSVMTDKDARNVYNAVKVNKQGPFCELCSSIEMTARIAVLKGKPKLAVMLRGWLLNAQNIVA